MRFTEGAEPMITGLPTKGLPKADNPLTSRREIIIHKSEAKAVDREALETSEATQSSTGPEPAPSITQTQRSSEHQSLITLHQDIASCRSRSPVPEGIDRGP